MHALEKLRDMLMEELEKLSQKDSLSSNALYTVDKLTHAIKCIDTIMAMEESSYAYESSYARNRGGRSRNAYENAYGGSYRNSYRRGGNSNRGYSRREMGYSRDDAKEELVEQLRDISMGTDGEHKQMIEEWIRQVES